MNLETLKQQLIVDEGYRSTVYRDSLGYMTVGIGHLVQPADNLHFGDYADNERVMAFFEHDVNHAIEGAKSIFKSFDDMPEDVQQVVVNMVFNLGATGLSVFKKFIAAVKAGNWAQAAEEMKDSIWYTQTGCRSRRLYNRMKGVKV